ncbi:T9SS type A sorting domain-containing protein [bacterium]|nr:T9SS type A sorting domain-containing protein [bacterium]
MNRFSFFIICVTFLIFMFLPKSSCAQDNLNIEKVGSLYNHWQAGREIIANKNVAYVANGTSGITVLDISIPDDIRELGWCDVPGYAFSMALYGNYLYVTGGGGFWDEYYLNHLGIFIIDVTSPFSPVCVDSVTEVEFTSHICISDTLAFITGSPNSYIYNISEPLSPQLLSTFNTGEMSRSMTVRDSIIYLAKWYAVQTWNISDLYNPYQVGIERRGGNQQSSIDPEYILLRDNYAYVISEINQPTILDISDPDDPYGVWNYGQLRVSFRASFYGQMLLIPLLPWNLRILDINLPVAPIVINEYQTMEFNFGISVSGNVAYLSASDGNGVESLDLTDPTSPQHLDFFHPDPAVEYIASKDGFVYVADKSNHLRVVDVRDPYSPVEVNAIDLDWGIDEWKVKSLLVEGDWLFFNRQDGRLLVMDISNPATPQYLANVEIRGYRYLVDGDYLYTRQGVILDMPDTLYVYDISDVQNPVEVSHLYMGYGMQSAGFLYSDGLIVSCSRRSVTFVDVSDPYSPRVVNTDYLESFPRFLQNDTLITSDGHEIYIYDVSNPARPRILSRFNEPEEIDFNINGFQLHGDNLFFSTHLDLFDGLIVYDISDMTRRAITGYFNSEAPLLEYIVSPPYVYTANTYHFNILDASDVFEIEDNAVGNAADELPESVFIGKCYPNPFNNTVSLSVTLPSQSTVKLEVYNLLGQQVYQQTAQFARGTHVLNFGNEQLVSGVYYLITQVGETRKTQKIVLLQ